MNSGDESGSSSIRQRSACAAWVACGFVALLVLGPGAAPVAAVDGVIELSQTRALAGGVTVGDSPGFPVTLGTSASYRLTSHLVLPNETLDAIVVLAADVTIDLNGFSILGPTICTGTPPGEPVSCTPENSTAAGIEAAGVSGLTVLNGTVRGMPWTGVNCGPRCRLVDLRVLTNGHDGILLGSGGLVEGCQLDRNGGYGVRAPGGSDGSTVRRSVVTYNGDGGISLFSGNLIESCMIGNNGGSGIVVTDARISGNSSWGNGLNGIVVNSGVVIGNLTYFNAVWGFNLTGSSVGFGGNAAMEGPANDVAGVPVALSGNLCSNAVCP
jgi:hypothetical protein